MPLVDGFGRIHDSLRISVTDRCNIRCFYCMPEEVKFQGREHILSFEEIEHFVRVAVSLGVRKLRITGGEPLVRKDLVSLVRKLSAIEGIQDLALTTNGVLLAKHAEELYDAGLRRLNVHLDTLDRERFLKITRRDELDKVLQGIELCRRLGYGPIKINAVAVKNLVEDDVVPLARYGRERNIEIRYIEFMPLDSQGLWDKGKVLLTDDMIEMLEREIGPLVVVPDQDHRAPATEYKFADGIPARVGFVASVSRPFCLELQSFKEANRRRQDPLLPVRRRRDRRARSAPAQSSRRRNRASHPILRIGQVDRSPNKHDSIRPPAAPDVFHRRLKSSRRQAVTQYSRTLFVRLDSIYRAWPPPAQTYPPPRPHKSTAGSSL